VTGAALLAEILEAHGGLERWRGFTGMSSTIVSGGDLWALKGASITATPRRATTGFRRQWTSITPFGGEGWTMRWSPGRVRIEEGAGAIVAERERPREAFEGHAYTTPWDPLHLAYFNGYAMWTYHALPFVLAEPGYEVAGIAPLVQEGVVLRGLRVRFPAEIHTHTRAQRLYFGPDGLLRRQDYEVEVWAGTSAAHMLSDYITVEGLRLPTCRIVHPRNPDGSVDAAVDLVTVRLSDYVLHRDAEAGGSPTAGAA
jgi:hypothetical protein